MEKRIHSLSGSVVFESSIDEAFKLKDILVLKNVNEFAVWGAKRGL